MVGISRRQAGMVGIGRRQPGIVVEMTAGMVSKKKMTEIEVPFEI